MNELLSFLSGHGIQGSDRDDLVARFDHHERQWLTGHVLMLLLGVAGMVGAAALATADLGLAWAAPLVMGILAALAVKAHLLWQREHLPAPLQQFCMERDEALARVAGHYPPY